MFESKKSALQEIFEIESISLKLSNYNSRVTISSNSLLEVLAKEAYNLSQDLGTSSVTTSKLVRYLWPDKPTGNGKICGWLLSKYGYKLCSSCQLVKELEFFSKNKSKNLGYNTHCKECFLENTRDYQREYQRTRKALKLDRVPSWADLDKIKQIYAECPEGYHVDHIVPLQGILVSGLHVENNLQYLTAEENIKKSNTFIIS